MDKLQDDKIRSFEQTFSNSVEPNGENLEAKLKHVKKTVMSAANILKPERMKRQEA